jgi:hypothetical protein
MRPVPCTTTQTREWAECPDCGKGRWLDPRRENKASRCFNCAAKLVQRERNLGIRPKRIGPNSSNWRGGRSAKQGYIWVPVSLDPFFTPMANRNGIVMQHRLVMAKHLGRCLQSWEFVHHKNGIKDDNRLENLELTTSGSHSILHGKGYRDGYAKGLRDGRDKQVRELKQTIGDLQTEIQLLRLNEQVPCLQ